MSSPTFSLCKISFQPNVILFILMLSSLMANAQSAISFPFAHKGEIKDTLWNQPISDPYRWLENLDSDSTQQWVKAQNEFFKKNMPKNFDVINEYLIYDSEASWDYFRKSGKYFIDYYFDDLETTPSILFKEKTNSLKSFKISPVQISGKKKIIIVDVIVSKDDHYAAICFSEEGYDWLTIRVADLQKKKLLEDKIEYVKYSDITWLKDGFVYGTFEKVNKQQSLKENLSQRTYFHHRVNTNQSDDLVILSTNIGNHLPYLYATDDQSLLIFQEKKIIKDKSYVTMSIRSLPLKEEESFKEILIYPDDNIYFDAVCMSNGRLFVHTNYKAPTGAINSYSLDKLNDGTKVVPPSAEILISAKLLGGKLICEYFVNDISLLKIFDLNAQLEHQFQFRNGFSVTNVQGGYNHNTVIFALESFYTPPVQYELNLETFKYKTISNTAVTYEYEDIATYMVTYKSADCTVIPMYLTHKKGLEWDGNNPVILYAYGGFGIRTQPDFNQINPLFFRKGGVLAVPLIRGGGEYPGWHELGKRQNKWNTISDFIAAAEYLLEKRITSPCKLGINGASHGGMVVAAAALLRPELFAAAVAEAGVYDMFRYHKFNIGQTYISEFGSVEDSLDFISLKSFSPLHQVKEGQIYPPTLLMTGVNDDRVPPFHSYKLLAALQNASSIYTYLLYLAENSGHSGGSSFKDYYRYQAIKYSFLFDQIGIEASKKNR
jgi:prolyl oligopeptidase